MTTVLADDPLTVLYDGRADAASNWYETTGVARWDGTRLVPVDEVGRSPRRTPTVPGATPAPSRCPTAGPGSTSRPPGPTARTTWSRWSAERGPALANSS